MNRLFSVIVALALAVAGCKSGSPAPYGAGGHAASLPSGGTKLGASVNVTDAYIDQATQGSPVFTDAAGKMKALAPGVAGRVLSTNGAGADPTWVVAGGGGYTPPTGTGLPHIVAGVQQGAASTLVDADVNAAAAIAVSKLANGAANQVLGTGPAWTGAPSVTTLTASTSVTSPKLLITAGSPFPAVWNASAISLTAGNVTVASGQIEGDLMVLTGTPTANRTVTLPNGGHWKIRNNAVLAGVGNASAYYVTVLGATSGTIWAQPGRTVEVVDTSGSGDYIELSRDTSFDIDVQNLSLIHAVATWQIPVLAIPASNATALVIAQTLLKIRTSPVGGSINVSLGTPSDGIPYTAFLPTNATGGVLGTIYGLDTTKLGGAYVANNGYMTSSQNTDLIIWAQVNQTVAACSVGAIDFKIAGFRQ